MSYLVLARKYRPQDFSSVTGQEQVTRTLANAIKRNKVAHAHLFCGPRGVGKTSIARIFSKALNCEGGPKTNPCMQCTNCREITEGSSLAVREIDGASHNSVDNVRDLIDSFRSLPPPGSKYKVYIIDEVHMLSVSAFNALLKSLEEPPPNTVFILATTEVHKIPETVLSRCVKHEFRALPLGQVQARLAEIAQSENLDVEPEVLSMVARLSEGSMRDAQTLLERVQSFCDDKITALEASLVLGAVDRITQLRLVGAILARQPKAALEIVQEIFSRGLDPTVLLREFVALWRELLLVQAGVELPLCVDREELQKLVKGIGASDLQDLVTLARQGCDAALRSSYVRIAFEGLVAKLASREPVASVGELLALARGGASFASAGSTGSGSGNGGSSGGSASGGSSGGTHSREVSAATNGARASSASAASSQANSGASRSTAASPTGAPNTAPFQWSSFLEQLTSSTPDLPMLARESLRKCMATFDAPAGMLSIAAQKFIIGGLAEHVTKLEVALRQYDPALGAVKVRLVEATGTTVLPDRAKEEQHRREREREVVEQDIANHPALKKIQEMFPGSSIESVRPTK